MSASSENEPQISITQVGATAGLGPYVMTFAIANAGGDDVRLIEARMPHVVLRADVVEFGGASALAAGAATRVQFDVTYQPREDASEPSNPFVILRLALGDVEWRVLAQLAVTLDERGAPTTTTAVLSAHRVGFSGAI
jgi:hypothetical protein